MKFWSSTFTNHYKTFKPVCSFSLQKFKYSFISVQHSMINKMLQPYLELLHF